MRDRVVHNAISTFRKFLQRQGFIDIFIRYGPESGKFVCTAYDPFDCKMFSREYDVSEMQCITHANKIFWRYII